VDATVRRATMCAWMLSFARARSALFSWWHHRRFDVWLELQAVDEKGQTLFWSGR